MAARTCSRAPAISGLQTIDLSETDGDQLDAFGRAVAVSGDTIFVSSPEARWDANGAGPGSVHRFARTGDTWTETQLIQADTPARGEYFGESMAVDGPLAIFSAPGATLGGMQFAGRIFVFEFDGAQWMQREVIQVPDEDVTELAGFGASLAIRGTQLAVGAPGVTVADVPFSGAAYLYDIAGDALMEKRFVADDPISGDYFGYAVALQLGGWQVASGVPHAFDDGSGNPGSTYVFTNDDRVRVGLRLKAGVYFVAPSICVVNASTFAVASASSSAVGPYLSSVKADRHRASMHDVVAHVGDRFGQAARAIEPVVDCAPMSPMSAAAARSFDVRSTMQPHPGKRSSNRSVIALSLAIARISAGNPSEPAAGSVQTIPGCTRTRQTARLLQ